MRFCSHLLCYQCLRELGTFVGNGCDVGYWCNWSCIFHQHVASNGKSLYQGKMHSAHIRIDDHRQSRKKAYVADRVRSNGHLNDNCWNNSRQVSPRLGSSCCRRLGSRW